MSIHLLILRSAGPPPKSVIGCTFVTALGTWLALVIKELFSVLTLIGSMRYMLRARYGV